MQIPELPPRFIFTINITITFTYSHLLGEYVRTRQMFNGFPVYKLEGSAHFFFYSHTGFWLVDSVLGGSGMLSGAGSGLRVPAATGWRYFENGRWIVENSLTWRAGWGNRVITT